ncbi:MAG: hypothetical protein PW999_00685 [Paraburkholderia tropica]|nr:hypothetical protein [Paraburkholderia tropica]
MHDMIEEMRKRGETQRADEMETMFTSIDAGRALPPDEPRLPRAQRRAIERVEAKQRRRDARKAA